MYNPVCSKYRLLVVLLNVELRLNVKTSTPCFFLTKTESDFFAMKPLEPVTRIFMFKPLDLYTDLGLKHVQIQVLIITFSYLQHLSVRYYVSYNLQIR